MHLKYSQVVTLSPSIMSIVQKNTLGKEKMAIRNSGGKKRKKGETTNNAKEFEYYALFSLCQEP